GGGARPAVKVARSPGELERAERTVAIGTFDGVHLGHRRVIEDALAAGPRPTVVTFDPHPRVALGYGVELISTLERRLELLAELGVEETLVVEFTLELAKLEPEEFARDVLEAIGARTGIARACGRQPRPTPRGRPAASAGGGGAWRAVARWRAPPAGGGDGGPARGGPAAGGAGPATGGAARGSGPRPRSSSRSPRRPWP